MNPLHIDSDPPPMNPLHIDSDPPPMNPLHIASIPSASEDGRNLSSFIFTYDGEPDRLFENLCRVLLVEVKDTFVTNSFVLVLFVSCMWSFNEM